MAASLRSDDDSRSEFTTNAAAEIAYSMVRADMELAASAIAQRAPKAGAHAPDFRLPDARGA